MCPAELTYVINTIAVAIAEGRNNNEVSILAAIFTQIGDTLATIVTQREICEGAVTDSTTVL